MRRNDDGQGAALFVYGKAVLMGGVTALLVCLLLLMGTSFCVSRGLLDGGLRYQITLVIGVLGSFLGGVVAVRRCPGYRLFVGLAAGGVLFLLQLTLGLLLYDSFSLENGGIGLLCSALCGGAAAGILGRGGKRTPVRGKKRRKS